MEDHVLFALENFEILDGIVEGVTILVMNLLPWLQLASKVLFHNPTMSANPFPVPE